MVENVKVSLLKVYEIDNFWSIWLLGDSESLCDLSAGRPGAATSEVESAVSALRLRGVPQGVVKRVDGLASLGSKN